MNLHQIILSLGSTVRNRKHHPEYVRVRAFERFLEPYETPAAVADALADGSPLTVEERALVVRTLLRAHQASSTKHPLWQALLLYVFAPMLKHVRARLRADSDDCDQQVLLGFLEVIARTNPDASAVLLTLRWATARKVFKKLRVELDGPELVSFDENAPECAPAPHLDSPPFVHCLAQEAANMLVEYPGGMAAIRAAVANDNIGDQVQRVPEAEKVTYGGLQRRSHRALKQVREKLNGDGST
jgi:hypothetical protein